MTASLFQRKSNESEPGPGVWTLEPYECSDGSTPYETFFRNLSSYQQILLHTAQETILKRQGHNVCGTEWGTALRHGLYEFRVRRSLSAICREANLPVPDVPSADKEVLLRVFFAVEGARIVLLLSAYDKGRDPSPRRQAKEIKRARSLLKEHQLREQQVKTEKKRAPRASRRSSR